MHYKTVKQLTVVDQLMALLKDMFLSGDLKPGDKMPSESELASHFGIGRNSLRETLKIFQFLGVIEVLGAKGSIVQNSENITNEALTWTSLIRGNEFTSIVELRMVMEQQGIWKLIELRKNDSDEFSKIIVDLQSEINNMDTSLKNNDEGSRVQADYRFHGILIHICNNKAFNTLYETLHAVTIDEMKVYQSELHQKNSTIGKHTNLLKALKENDFKFASTLFREHIGELYEHLNNKYISAIEI